jgi:hypothetical protein
LDAGADWRATAIAQPISANSRNVRVFRPKAMSFLCTSVLFDADGQVNGKDLRAAFRRKAHRFGAIGNARRRLQQDERA